VLDLFAGSGALAIEAVSRGAGEAVLVEKSPRAAAVVRQNLKACGLELRVLTVNYRKGMEILQNEQARFDLIFADPPYDSIPRQTLLDDVARYRLLAPEGLCILEHAGHVPPDNSPSCLMTRRFGDTAISIYRL
jgi:16S rRNA (guanine(966)-N(2))-methyltransferase RsmD